MIFGFHSSALLNGPGALEAGEELEESALKRTSSRDTTWRGTSCYCESHCGQRHTHNTHTHLGETCIKWQPSHQKCHVGGRRRLNVCGPRGD